MIVIKKIIKNDDKFEIFEPNTIEELIDEGLDYEFSIQMTCSLDLNVDDGFKCTNYCKRCEKFNISAKPCEKSLYGSSIPLSMLNQFNKIIDEIDLELPIQKDFYIETKDIRPRIDDIHMYIKTITDSDYEDVVDIDVLEKALEISRNINRKFFLLKKIYFRYRKYNVGDDLVVFNTKKEALLEYVMESLSFLSDEREKALKYTTDILVDKIKRGEVSFDE